MSSIPQPVAIHGLKLSNFRNAENAQYTFSDGLIFITGNNGAGKTTILEALGLASFLKSFRFALDREMVRFNASFYRLEVADSGSGIHQEDLLRIFQRFAQGQRGRTILSGTGLGLYLCRRLVEAHGGEITCSSVDGQGTTFVVSLPLEQSCRDLS